MAQTGPEREIRCPACERLFPVSELRKHQRQCPQMARVDREIPDRCRNLRK